MEQSNYTTPQPGLGHMIQGFWQVERSNTAPVSETIIPTGVVEIIFNLNSASIHSQVGEKYYQLPRCFINGFNTQPIEQQIPGHQTFFGVALHTTAVKRLFNITADDFADSCTDMTLVDTSLNSLWHQLADQSTFAERVQILSDVFTRRMTRIDAQEQAFNRFISGYTNSTLSVAQVADLLCYSPRQLSRKLRALTGLNTEENLLYKKYLHALELIHHSPLSLTQVAYTCQFTDQSHFNKTFKSFTGLTPREYRNRKSQLVGHLFENVR
ncbi:helix-turn-helix transcriptional regulator [Spirosoma sp. BT702]|uniref:Helix-turn-helix transcriptional regulator n=1 Tax=Spirosoma profusum TaxID=2771354 RepID=A0A927ASK7_9BACT|nr:helix-turn-helix transcriptional regulator [Spirosoma profusum]MBD2704036.1 helix-turn-helix transcriptional regulator [Spirosoma profusum]